MHFAEHANMGRANPTRYALVGFDIDHASRKLDLSKIETCAPPATAAK